MLFGGRGGLSCSDCEVDNGRMYPKFDLEKSLERRTACATLYGPRRRAWWRNRGPGKKGLNIGFSSR